ncbi:hypothetical protein RHGRI_006843 [Rhododendron griersonianum]|uniref:Uncharacterized protein n=1 Tax=Rhododendron griersonianum TaxID=479676 RepID=A0AAV6KVU2_9ERIC|nr:hypothetical protein RHGRI_006843 [Rhododendron griersonianum]
MLALDGGLQGLTIAAHCSYDEPSKTAVQCQHKMEKLRKQCWAEKLWPDPRGAWKLFNLMDNLERPIDEKPANNDENPKDEKTSNKEKPSNNAENPEDEKTSNKEKLSNNDKNPEDEKTSNTNHPRRHDGQNSGSMSGAAQWEMF